ncbi:MAG: DUF928 domain-containing protein [Oscillatoriales cyanobacterium]|nr:MAG: DUF928 domain-containing protein [Oscillatoriales cyanobacterium]
MLWLVFWLVVSFSPLSPFPVGNSAMLHRAMLDCFPMGRLVIRLVMGRLVMQRWTGRSRRRSGTSPVGIVLGVIVLGVISILGISASASLLGMTATATEPKTLQGAERPPVPGTNQPPGRRRGAGSFSGCVLTDERDPAKLLVALVPEVQLANGESVVLAQTQRDRPMLWFYVAYPAGTALEWVLQDAAGNTLDRQQQIMGSQPGLLGFSSASVSLTNGQDYRWYLKIRCSGPNSSPDDYVNGTLQKLSSDRPTNQPWLDRLDAALSPRSRTDGFSGGRSPWASLLEQVGLGDLAEARPVATP